MPSEEDVGVQAGERIERSERPVTVGGRGTGHDAWSFATGVGIERYQRVPHDHRAATKAWLRKYGRRLRSWS